MVPLLAPPPDRWELRGYRLDLDSLGALWVALGSAADVPVGKPSRRLVIHAAHGEARDAAQVDDVARAEVTAFVVEGWDRSWTTLAVDRRQRTASISFRGVAPAVFLKYLQPLRRPRRLSVAWRDPYRFVFDPLTAKEGREARRTRRWQTALFAATVAVPILLAVLARH